MQLEPHLLKTLSACKTVWVGFSGGLDSTVLLHALFLNPVLRPKLHAVHIHHGLSQEADAWFAHCQDFCAQREIAFTVRKVQLSVSTNIEESARVARYQVFTELLQVNDCLLTGHHRNDQAETLLLQLFRGSGVDGMAAMPVSKPLGRGVLIRPLLEWSRERIEGWALQYQLDWVDDESNENTMFSRNFIRHTMLPLIQTRWPGVTETLGRSAVHFQQARTNLRALALLDCPQLEKISAQLPLHAIRFLERARLANVLRVWLNDNQAPTPSTQILSALIEAGIYARQDAQPCIRWGDVEVRRHAESLFLIQSGVVSAGISIDWLNFPEPLLLQSGLLSASPAQIGLHVPPGVIPQIRFRQGGERFYWHGQHKKLKKLFQEWGIFPWQRTHYPLVFIQDQLAAVPGFAVSDLHTAEPGEKAHTLELSF